jgi:hypothetical protein
MIFFCEDCGEKNLLAPEQFKNGKAIFRCKSCDYLNSYYFKQSDNNQLPDKNYCDEIQSDKTNNYK